MRLHCCIKALFAAVLRIAANYCFHGCNLTVDILAVVMETGIKWWDFAVRITLS